MVLTGKSTILKKWLFFQTANEHKQNKWQFNFKVYVFSVVYVIKILKKNFVPEMYINKFIFQSDNPDEFYTHLKDHTKYILCIWQAKVGHMHWCQFQAS